MQDEAHEPDKMYQTPRLMEDIEERSISGSIVRHSLHPSLDEGRQASGNSMELGGEQMRVSVCVLDEARLESNQMHAHQTHMHQYPIIHQSMSSCANQHSSARAIISPTGAKVTQSHPLFLDSFVCLGADAADVRINHLCAPENGPRLHPFHPLVVGSCRPTN